jgi:AT-rich interactive domain-containing protein 2
MKLKLVPSWQSEKESCVTRSLRLTAALVLRNILEKIPGAYHKLKVYESLFADVAFSNNEASFVTSQCLYFLSPPSLNSSKLSS